MRTRLVFSAVALSVLLWTKTAPGQPSPSGTPAPRPDLPATPVMVILPLPVSVSGTGSEDSQHGTEPAAEPEKVKAVDNPPAVRPPEFFGDQAPVNSLLILPRGPFGGQGALLVPSARYFKISDNESPRPQTASYFSFNYFYNLNGDINHLAGDNILHTRIHREIFGAEWATPDGSASIGLRLPLDTFNATHPPSNLDGTSTDIGDLTVIFKEVLWENRETGNLLSAGLAITPPTGPGSFAGSHDIKVFHNTVLQPFGGWIWNHGQFYLQGFTAVDAPTDLNDVVLLENSLAIGYFLLQKHDAKGLSAVVPTLEVHVTTPLNHRGVLPLNDPAGTPDMVNLTGGIHFEECDRSSTGIAFAVPVTGPRMFDFEILAQFRWRY